MAIDKEKKLIFIHPDKCAGKSIEKCIFGISDQGTNSDHRPLTKHVSQEEIDNYFKFTTARNPWDRVVSRYYDACNRFRYKGTLRDHITLWYKRNNQGKWDNDVRWEQRNCIDMIKDHNGNINIDMILRFENLKSDWEILQEKIGYGFILPHSNKNKNIIKHYSEEYIKDEQTRNSKEIPLKDMVHQMYLEDINYFDYKYEEV
jgi:hypothetical protein